MKNLLLITTVLVFYHIFSFSSEAQTYQTLDEQMAFAFSQNFPDWKSDTPQIFNMNIHSGGTPAFEALLKNGERKLIINVRLFESNAKAVGDLERFFYMRSIMPRTRELPTIGDKSLTAETAERVEISFVKENIYVSLYSDFPRTGKDKKGPDYIWFAPDTEFEFVRKAANILAAMIIGQKTVSPCFNNFIKFPYPPENTKEEKFLAAAYRGENDSVKNFISQNIDINAKGSNGDTALHLAIKQGCFETIKTIVDAKADVNAKNERGETPLMTAAAFGNSEAVKLLFSSGADIKAKTSYGRNAAFLALLGPNGNYFWRDNPKTDEKIQILDVLKNAGLDLTQKEDSYGHTLLIDFIDNRRTMDEKLFKVLLGFGVDVNGKSNFGENALIKAVRLLSYETRTAVVRFLIEHGAEVNHKDDRGFTALNYLKEEEKRYTKDDYKQSSFQHYKDVLELLVQAGAKE